MPPAVTPALRAVALRNTSSTELRDAPMKPLHELINHEEPGWPLVQSWVAGATNPVEILQAPSDAERGRALFETQVTTRSPMGAVLYESGGLFIDHGWIRVLGAGHSRLPRSLPRWNLGRSYGVAGESPPFLLVADDVVGGFFAIDGGGLAVHTGKVCYFAPDSLAWESTDLGYSEFLIWCFSGDLAQYYKDFRWPGWQDETQRLGGDLTFAFYPFLSCSGPTIVDRSRRAVDVAEVYDFNVGRLASG